MTPDDTILTITLDEPAGTATRTLRLHCPHGTTTLELPTTLDAAAERAITALGVLQHYSTTGCRCTRRA